MTPGDIFVAYSNNHVMKGGTAVDILKGDIVLLIAVEVVPKKYYDGHDLRLEMLHPVHGLIWDSLQISINSDETIVKLLSAMTLRLI